MRMLPDSRGVLTSSKLLLPFKDSNQLVYSLSTPFTVYTCVILMCDGGGGDSFLSFFITLSGSYAIYNNFMY